MTSEIDDEIRKNLRAELASRLHSDIEDALEAFEARNIMTLAERTKAIADTLTHLTEGLRSMAPRAAE